MSGYSRVREEDDLETSSKLDETVTESWQGRLKINWVNLAWTLLLCFSMFLAGIMMMMMVVDLPRKPSDKACTAQLSVWSPLVEAVQYEERDWVSIFATKNSPFTGPPTRELESNWDAIIEVPSVIIPSNRVPSLNRDIKQGFVPVNNDSLTPGYVAGVEVFHHLHCVNVLRQYLWRDSYPEDMTPTLLKFNTPKMAREHAEHCIEALRLGLMCNADITPYFLHEGEPAPGSDVSARDFQAFHKCKRFDRLLNWMNENGVIVPYTHREN
ncbi:hypothetical protein LZ32DRAFT_630560 [Colletotrichum eremochloae]|nr:hypothetical protein LZ32DRAFT_630560 [Colletotrichum eremochloae]